MAIQPPKIIRTKKGIPPRVRIFDIVPNLQRELFIIRNPKFRREPFAHLLAWKKFVAMTEQRIIFAYYPLEKYAVRMLDENLYFEARTARNRNLITKEEQAAYRKLSVGVAGLSVGSSIVSALVLTGGPKKIKIADFDTLDPSNLNRIRAGLSDVGTEKIELAARDVWAVDPFAQLQLWNKGVTQDTLSKFILGAPKLDIFIDEMDDLASKVAARIIARKHRIPVLMATDNGDGAMLDVERFDLEPRRPIFHGLVGNLSVKEAAAAKGPAWFAIAGKIIGVKFMPPRHHASLAEVGKTLAGIPQLGTDALIAGCAISLAVRKIAAGQPLASGKYIVNLDGTLKKAVVK